MIEKADAHFIQFLLANESYNFLKSYCAESGHSLKSEVRKAVQEHVASLKNVTVALHPQLELNQ